MNELTMAGVGMIELTMADLDMMDAEMQMSGDPDFAEDKEWTEYFYTKIYDEIVDKAWGDKTEMPPLLEEDIDHRIKYIVCYYHAHIDPMGVWVVPSKDSYKNRPSVINKQIIDALDRLKELYVIDDTEYNELKTRRETISVSEIHTKVRASSEAELTKLGIPSTEIKKVLNFIDSL